MTAPKDNNPPPTPSPAVSKVVSRFWQERAQGRQVSVDDLLATSEGIENVPSLRASVIQTIADQAASFSGEHSEDTLANIDSITKVLGHTGPVPIVEGYDLVTCLGRGGMGAVYEGYQHSTGRRVALKFMHDSMGVKESARKRFEREVEVVARLQHPNIVSIIDSGVRKGRYYYVMDFVDGWPLDASMVPGRCDVRNAIELIIRICDAVDYAHQRGILHRDLKPGNIMVDDQGQPHLLDFGLAKVFDPSSGEGESHGRMGLTVSGPGQLLGTVAYMSPEQAQGKHNETSVRADVYAVGAIAYELLTGRLPISVDHSLRDVLQRIIEQDPPAPSSLRSELSRDMDAVLLKALEKSPQRRYATIGEFAADLRRALAREPVTARRISGAGRAWRWVQRNRAVSAVSAAALFTLIAVSTVLVAEIMEESAIAARERDIANENFNRLRSILESADPETSPGGATVLQLLDTATNDIDESPPEIDLAEAQIREVLGTVYRKLGEYAKAVDHQRKALAIRERHAGSDGDASVADALHNLAATLWWDGSYAEAEGMYTRSLAIRRRLYDSDHKDIATSLTHLAACWLRMGKYSEARETYEEILAMRRRIFGSEHEAVAQALNNLAKCLLEADEFERAESLHRDSLAMITRLKGISNVGTAAASHNLGDCMLRRSQAYAIAGDTAAAREAAEQAREAFQQSLDIRRALYESSHHFIAASVNGVARAEMYMGNYQRAEQLARECIDIFHQTRREDHPDLATGWATLGEVLAARGAVDEAADALESALNIAESARPPSESQVALLRGLLGEVFSSTRTQRAEQLLQQSYEETRALRGDTAVDTIAAARRLVAFYELHGVPELANEYRRVAQRSG